MRRTRFLLTVMLVVLFASAPLISAEQPSESADEAGLDPAALNVRLKPSVQVPSELPLTLGQIAVIEGVRVEQVAQLPLGRAPSAGQQRAVSQRSVWSALEKSGFAPEQFVIEGAALTRVLGIGQLLDEERVRQAVNEAIPQLLPEAVAEVEEIRMPGRFMLPAGEYEVRVLEPRVPIRTGLVRLPLEIELEGGPVRRTGIYARLTVERPVVVAARDLPRGERVKPTDLRLVRSSKSSGEELSDPADAVGRIVRASLRMGQPVRDLALAPSIAVETGQQVVAIYQRGGIELTLDTVARGRGEVGAIVPVVGPDGHGIVRARVTGPGVVVIVGSDELNVDEPAQEPNP
ncbi:MAG: flagellar basal body P-ring formation protein FlgA [Acidobacteriota bacterium]|nr:MAG: flagellar basal body P-ring formation protein FlgA [Acidobacteriota bacterium]